MLSPAEAGDVASDCLLSTHGAAGSRLPAEMLRLGVHHASALASSTAPLTKAADSSRCSNPDVVDTCKRMSSQPCDAIAAELAKAAVAKGRCACAADTSATVAAAVVDWSAVHVPWCAMHAAVQ